MTIVEKIIQVATENFIAATREGFDGSFREYEQTEADCDRIAAVCEEAYGHKPLRAQWKAAGFEYVGSAHVRTWADLCARSMELDATAQGDVVA